MFFVKNSPISPLISTGKSSSRSAWTKTGLNATEGWHFVYTGASGRSGTVRIGWGNHLEAQSDVLFITVAGRGLGRGSSAPDCGPGMESVRRHRPGHVWGSADRFSRHPDQIKEQSVTEGPEPGGLGRLRLEVGGRFHVRQAGQFQG